MDGRIRLAVTGNPISHSMSPQIFYKFLEVTNLLGFYSRIAADSFQEAIDTAEIAGITGLNVTSPFKEDAAVAGALSSSIDNFAEKLMAANTVVIKNRGEVSLNSGISVFNTDCFGVYESVKNVFPEKKEKTAFVIGAGGAGIAAAYALTLAGFNVAIFNRTASKAKEKIKWIKNCSAAGLEDINKIISSADIIINALPVSDVFIDINKIKKDAVIFDANYKNSILINLAKENGLKTISGLTWLINQAASAFEIFTGLKLPDNYNNLFLKDNLTLHKKNNISLIGFMGSGKTTIACYLADFFKTDFIDIDKEIEKIEKTTIADIFKYKGEGYFRQIEKKITQSVFGNEKGKVIACGGGAVKDGENRKIISSASFPVWLTAPPEVSINRITDYSRPLLNTLEKNKEAVKLFNERIDFYGITSSLIIDSSKRSALDTAKKLYEEISQIFKS